MTQYSRPLLILLLLLSACTVSEQPEFPAHLRDIENLTAYPADVEPLNSIELTLSGSYENNEEVLMGYIFDVEADQLGRIYLKDISQTTFHIVNSDGSYITSLGREGRGPGEFLDLSVLEPIIAYNRLYIFDDELSRISLFDLETLTLSHTIDLNPQNWNDIEELTAGGVNDFYVQSDSMILLKFASNTDYMNNPYKYYFFYINNAGERISDIILQQEGPEPISYTLRGPGIPLSSHDEPFMEKPLFVTTAEGSIVTATTGEFLINLYQPGGEAMGAIYYPIEKQRLNRNEVLNGFNSRFIVPSSIELPEYWPVLYGNIVADDENRLWVPTIVEESRETVRWWVLDLDQQGELLAWFEWPRNRTIEVVKNGFVYTIERDEETAIRRVTRYRMVLSER